MKTWQIISALIIGLISVLLFTYSFFSSKEKGPILSNSYLFASNEERKRMNLSAEYHLVTIIFRNLGLIFLLLTVKILTSWFWLNYFLGILIVYVMIYAIKETIKSEKSSKLP